MARRWRVSKSEALRRAIHAAAAEGTPSSNQAIAALDELQRSLVLTTGRAEAWARRARMERRTASARRARKGH